MAAGNEVNLNECKRIVSLNTWVLISNFKLAYTLLRRPDGSFNRYLSEFLDRKVPPNSFPLDGVSSSSTNLLTRIYLPSPLDPSRHGAVDLTEPLSTAEIVPFLIFFHGGSFTHSSANRVTYNIINCGYALKKPLAIV